MNLENCSETNWKRLLINLVAFILLYPSIFIVMFILIPVISVPVVIIRWVIDKAAHSKRDFVGLGEMVNSIDSLFLRDAIYSNPKCNCLFTFTMEGEMEISRLQETFRNKLLNVTSPDGSLKYPKFRQCLKQWCGYFFWNDVLDFDLEKQITLHPRSKDGETTSEKEMQEIVQELINQKWVKGQPLWDVTLVHNYQPIGGCNKGQTYSCVLFRIHHIKGDGFSFTCYFKDWLTHQDDSDSNAVITIDRKERTSDWSQKFLWNIALPFRLAFHAIEVLAIKQSFPLYWEVPTQHGQKNGKCWTQSTGPISVKKIKDIKNHFGVSFTSVLLAAQTGAHHDVLEGRGKELAEILPSAVSVLLPGHPGKMANNSVATMIKLPLREEDPLNRLLKCHEEEQQFKSLIGARFTIEGVKFCGLFPPEMTKWFSPSILAFVTSNMSFNNFEFYGDSDEYNTSNKVTSVSFALGLQIGRHGIIVASVSYNGYITFNTTVHQALMGEEESLQFSSAIVKHINILHQLTL